MALATVIEVEGSAYRRPGARMLISETGEYFGGISGGCLEGDALRKAKWVIESKTPKVLVYDTEDQDDARLGYQLGCNGTIHILLEPLDPGDPANPLEWLSQVLAERDYAVLVTLFSQKASVSGPRLTRFLYRISGQIVPELGTAWKQTDILADAGRVLISRTSQRVAYSLEGVCYEGLLELLRPAVSLVLVGAGNDARPLSQMASLLGWEVNIFDGRPLLATRSRFAEALQVQVAKPAELFNWVCPGDHTAFVLMTHNYPYDLAVLEQLSQYSLPYIGVLGPKKRLEHLLQDLGKLGIRLSSDFRDRLFGPAGLELGAEGPEEIALSILSEISAVLSGCQPGFLRDRKSPIHSK